MARVSQDCLRTVNTIPWPSQLPDLSPIEYIWNQVWDSSYRPKFGTASWESHEFQRTRGKVTGNMERNVSRHHTELVCLNARSCPRFVHSR
ncbi:uncharacterized protein TNCV_1634691 [Trichonephila clavipes]|nr:uncharacterized protein TNCV_1634691 [Trichonephila clavipes]